MANRGTAWARTSQFGIEDALEDLLPATPGFFVEVGGADGVTQSNTFYMEKILGWRGLIVEPVPWQATLARVARPSSLVVCALCQTSSKPTWLEDEALTSSVSTERSDLLVAGVQLSELLKCLRQPDIEFMSLDVEGNELQILEDLMENGPRPKVILVEANDHRVPGYLSAQQYDQLPPLTPHDWLFQRRV